MQIACVRRHLGHLELNKHLHLLCGHAWHHGIGSAPGDRLMRGEVMSRAEAGDVQE